MVKHNGLTFTGRPGTAQLSNHEDRSAGPVQCNVGLCRSRASPLQHLRDTPSGASPASAVEESEEEPSDLLIGLPQQGEEWEPQHPPCNAGDLINGCSLPAAQGFNHKKVPHPRGDYEVCDRNPKPDAGPADDAHRRVRNHWAVRLLLRHNQYSPDPPNQGTR